RRRDRRQDFSGVAVCQIHLPSQGAKFCLRPTRGYATTRSAVRVEEVGDRTRFLRRFRTVAAARLLKVFGQLLVCLIQPLVDLLDGVSDLRTPALLPERRVYPLHRLIQQLV